MKCVFKNVVLLFSLGRPLRTAEMRHEMLHNVTRVVRLDQQSSSIPSHGLVLGNQWRELENMKAQFVAVNGIRKVACVVSSHYILFIFLPDGNC